MAVEANFDGLGNLGRNINRGLENGLKDAGDMIENLASQLAPKDSGDLSTSGKVEVIGPKTVQVSFGNDLPDARAVAQEYGTVDMPAQPYLTPASTNISVMQAITDAIIKSLQ